MQVPWEKCSPLLKKAIELKQVPAHLRTQLIQETVDKMMKVCDSISYVNMVKKIMFRDQFQIKIERHGILLKAC